MLCNEKIQAWSWSRKLKTMKTPALVPSLGKQISNKHINHHWKALEYTQEKCLLMDKTQTPQNYTSGPLWFGPTCSCPMISPPSSLPPFQVSGAITKLNYYPKNLLCAFKLLFQRLLLPIFIWWTPLILQMKSYSASFPKHLHLNPQVFQWKVSHHMIDNQ